MNELTEGVSWLAVAGSTILSFMLGGLWYSSILFGAKWAEGVGVATGPGAKQPLGGLLTQLAGTFLLAWLMAVLAASGAYGIVVLVVLAATLLLIAANLFSAHSLYASLVQGGFVVAMALIMLLCNVLL